MKECRRCHKMKPLEDFHRRSKSLDGRNSYCKECANEALREWRHNNPDKARKYARRYYQENIDECRERGRAYYAAHKEEDAERYRKWAAANRDIIKAYKRHYDRERYKRMKGRSA
jgi:hypothetical protein